MHGINLEPQFDTMLTRRLPQELNYIDNVNSPDVFADGTLGIQVSDLEGGKIQEGMLADASVTTAALADLSVDTEKLANLAVEAAKLGNSSVESTKIANLAVGSAAIAALAVGTAHVANGAILNAKIGDAQIDNAKISNLSADKINAGELIGRTVKATGGTGVDTWLNNNGQLLFRYGNSTKAYMQSDTAGRLIIDGDASITLRSDGTGDDIILKADARVDIQSNAKIQFEYNKNGGTDDVEWISAGTKRMFLNQDGVLDVDSKFSVGGNDGETTTRDLVTSVWWDGSDLKYNYRRYTFTGGILTSEGSENTTGA